MSLVAPARVSHTLGVAVAMRVVSATGRPSRSVAMNSAGTCSRTTRASATAPRHRVGLTRMARIEAFAGKSRTTTLPATCAAEIQVELSVAKPAYTVGVPASAVGGADDCPGRKSTPSVSGAPSAASRDCGSTLTVQNGTVWKKVPFSPAGSSPSRLNSDATYSAVW